MYTIMTARSLKSLFNWLFNSGSLTKGRWNATKNNEKKKGYWSLQTTSNQNMLGNVYENITTSSWHYSCPRSVCCRWRVFSGPSTTYPDFLESTTFSLRIRLPSTRIRWIRHTNPQIFFIRSSGWKFLNTLWIRNRGDAKSGYIFLSDDITISTPVLALIFTCKHNVFASLLLGPFFKTSNVCAVKPSYDYCSLQICQTAARQSVVYVGRTNWTSETR